MNTIGNKIRLLRESKGFSQESIAQELGITQPSYARLEKQDERISITRLIQIATLLKTTVGDLIGEKAQKVINQQNSEYASAYVDSIINADKEHIATLKEEIVFLRQLLEKK
ncbi:helix-turn-helix domain-containing protein [Flavobacterium sp.]|uniref:helix-turn-helix domain-containing protein n=1 Tax=Flavobacterium sp. TaxID=239 RepID=UPI004048797B